MKLAAAIVAILASVVAAAAAAGPAAALAPVLGFSYANTQLAWFDPATLRQVSRRSAPIAYHACAWELSADRTRLASSSCGGDSRLTSLRFVNTRTLRPLGDLSLRTLGYVQGLAWLRPDRLLAVVNREEGGALLLVVDPQRRRLLRREVLGKQLWWFARLHDRAAFLLVPEGRFGAAEVGVVGADGEVRRTTIDGISVGSIVDESGDEPSSSQRGAGFAVDPVARAGYVVGADLLVARVDLDSLEVTYRRPVVRAMQKSIEGPQRSAAWLGNGLLAVGGVDYATGKDAAGKPVTTSTPFGLRLVDTGDWTVRTVDLEANWVRLAGDTMLAQSDGPVTIAYGPDGRERWRTTIPQYSWLDARGDYAYVCDNGYLRRVLDVRTGTTTASFPRTSNRRCAALLTR